MNFLIPMAYADTAAAGTPPGGEFMQFILLGGFLVVFYLMVWRPQSKRAKEHRNLVGGLQKGDEVVTSGGIAGKVTKVADEFVMVEVSDKADPPVCRIMNFDKFRYELKKKQQEAKKKQTVIETREIKFRPKTEEHDLAFKIRKIREFLEEKNKVKVTMRFRGREIVYAQTIGMDALTKIADTLREDCVIIQEPKMEGRQMIMMISPR